MYTTSFCKCNIHGYSVNVLVYCAQYGIHTAATTYTTYCSNIKSMHAILFIVQRKAMAKFGIAYYSYYFFLSILSSIHLITERVRVG